MRLRENTPEHGRKFSNGQGRRVGVECGIVVLLDKFRSALEVRMSGKHAPHVAVHADMAEEVMALETPCFRAIHGLASLTRGLSIATVAQHRQRNFSTAF
ncbi:MAG: hypothetical protein JO269_04640 [Burkholderiaceae bacterium]|nr:hypothetical protein [Burkholderiaceae bacterium]